MITGRYLPHPIPYQGSKRSLTQWILPLFPREKVRLFEPFAGSAAVSIAAAANSLASGIILSDTNGPLMGLWDRIINKPREVITTYQRLWHEQSGNERFFYDHVRDQFNKDHNPDYLLYLLARCVKAPVRYNAEEDFNQSPDNRRKGAKPETMAKHILNVSHLLQGITTSKHCDFRIALSKATEGDLIYMDPPYQGVTGGRDNRYLEGLSYDDFVSALHDMNRRNLSFIISYDGRTGGKTYGQSLPAELNLKRIEVDAGISSQATLLGTSAKTIESLYLSTALLNRIGFSPRHPVDSTRQFQMSLF